MPISSSWTLFTILDLKKKKKEFSSLKFVFTGQHFIYKYINQSFQSEAEDSFTQFSCQTKGIPHPDFLKCCIQAPISE